MRKSRISKVNGSPSQNGGLPVWLYLIVALVLVIAGVSQRKNQAAVGANEKPPLELAQTASVAPRRERVREPAIENPQANRLAAFARELEQEADSQTREDLTVAWVAEIKLEEISQWLNFLQSAAPTDLAHDLSKRLIRRWTDVVPEKAAVWVTSLPDDQQPALIEDVAVVWATSNPTNAASWAGALPDRNARCQALTAVAGEAVRSDPMIALRIAIDLPDGPQRNDLIQRGAMQWASEDANGAVDWVKQMPAGPMRDQALSGVAIVWSASEPVAAANLALNELKPGRVLDDTVISILQRWAQKDFNAAFAWAKQFPPGPLRETAMDNLLAQSARQAETGD